MSGIFLWTVRDPDVQLMIPRMGSADGHPAARVERACAGDRRALEELLRESESRLKASLSINPRWQSSLDADDVVQVTFLEAFLRIESLRQRSEAGLFAWLARIARNNLRDAVRALESVKRPHPGGRTNPSGTSTSDTLLAQLCDSAATAGTLAVGKEAVELLELALAQLPETYRRVVREIDLNGRAVSELAGELGTSPGAVHMRRLRAHDRLRDALGSATGFLPERP